jgi:hypothetical protein
VGPQSTVQHGSARREPADRILHKNGERTGIGLRFNALSARRRFAAA